MNPLTQIADVLLRNGATIVGTALGGPAGAAIAGVVVGALRDALGLPADATEETVAQTMATDPHKARDAAKRVEAQQGGAISDLEARLADVANARAMQTHAVDASSPTQWAPVVVSVIVLAGFSLLSWVAMRTVPGTSERDVVLFLLGAWLSLATGAVNFWLGSSQGSKDKDSALALVVSRPSPPAPPAARAGAHNPASAASARRYSPLRFRSCCCPRPPPSSR